MPLVIGASDVVRLLTPERALASQERAFRALAAGEADLADKVLLEGDPGIATTLVYAARCDPRAGVAAKLVSVAEDNPGRGLPAVTATVLLTDPATGMVAAVIDGTELTTLRTAAAAALSVRELARPDAEVLAVLGSGVQARAHVRAIAGVRRLSDVRIWSPTAAHREAAARELAAQLRASVRTTSSAEIGRAHV